MSDVQDLQQRSGVHLLSGNLPEAMEMEAVFGIVHGQAIIGANFVKDFFARVADVTGGRVSGYERALQSAIETALNEVARHARALGANAVINIDIDASPMGKSMVMAVAYGTAVIAKEKSSEPVQAQPIKYLNPQPLG